MLAARASAAVALRSVRANPAYVGMCRVSPRQLSGKPPEPAEVDDTEEIKQAMETIVAANGSFGELGVADCAGSTDVALLCSCLPVWWSGP